ncbi:MAG: MarR family winged helix-turn-helix transcriptional regulator [Oscillospiraceae bacterium]
MDCLLEELRKNPQFIGMRLNAEKCAQLIKSIQRFGSINMAGFFEDISPSEMSLMHCAQSYADSGCALTVNEAAAELNISMPAVSRTLKSLSERGLLERRTDDSDRRSVRILTTEKGSALLKRNIEKCFLALNAALAPFSEEELSAMVEMHSKFTKALSDYVSGLKTEQNK